METAVFLIFSFLAQLLPLCQGGESEIVTLADGSKLRGHQRFRYYRKLLFGSQITQIENL